MHKIIVYNEKYRDDVIFCLLYAKNALGKIPRLNEDLLDIKKNYFNNDDMFWIAVDGNNRVVGMVGTKTFTKTDMWLKRLYVKPEMKRQGIGSCLLATVEKYAKEKGIKTIHTRFADDYYEAACFYPAQGFVETKQSEGLRHLIKVL